MPYKDQEKQKAYQREWQRVQKSGGKRTGNRTLNLSSEELKTARGLLDLLAESLANVHDFEADPMIKGRCIAYMVSVGLRLVETVDLEQRLNDIEKHVKGRAAR